MESEMSFRPHSASVQEQRSESSPDIPGLSKHQESASDTPNYSPAVMVSDTSSRSPQPSSDPSLSQWSPYLEKRKLTQQSDHYPKKRRLLSPDTADVTISESLSPYVFARGNPWSRF